MRFFCRFMKISVFITYFFVQHANANITLSDNDKNMLRRINAEINASKYDNALAMSNRLNHKVAQKYIQWKYLTASNSFPTYNQLYDFMEKNPNMPNRIGMQSKLENTLSLVSRDTQKQFFSRFKPITAEGRFMFVDFLFASNQTTLAIQKLKELWHTEVLTQKQQTKILTNYRQYLSVADYSKRIRLLGDKNRFGEARLLLRYGVRSDAQKITLRQKLNALGRDAVRAYQNASYEVKQDAGVLRSLVRYYRKTNQEKQAIMTIANLTTAQSADNPEAWYESRSILSRVAFRRNMKKQAYMIAAMHATLEGAAYVDSEFYAGWLALRHFNSPQNALKHFKNGRAKSSLPVSVSRFEYWIGRACDALNDKICSQTAYANAGKYFYTFYGQLANYQMGIKTTQIPQYPQATPQIKQAYLTDDVIQASYIANYMNNQNDIRFLLTSVAERIGKHPAIYPLLEKTTQEIGDLKTRVKLAKAAGIHNDFLMNTGYPIIPLRQIKNIPEVALIYALTRQESEYDQYAKSPVGASGMMQLMPRTAQMMAREMRLPYQQGYLTQKPDYNMTLGGYYLNKLVRQFNGSYIHALSGYNAGPSRIKQWNQSYGYFTPDLNHIIDRIEIIPFAETRNYVQRILESVQVYRAKIIGKNYISNENLVQDLKRGL
jgi:soluble lytic murein transglycosylase